MFKFVSIFRTNISTEIEKNRIIKMLYSLDRGLNVSLDLEDDERILRVAAEENLTMKVAQLVQSRSYLCEEMECFYLGNSVKD